jgi:ribosomal protein S18 acetylase RimI-like enzyme
MNTPVSIRGATPTDADAILECLRLAFEPYRASYTPDGYEDTVLTAETIHDRLTSMSVLVAVTAEGAVVGTIAHQMAADSEGHLRGMAVLPAHVGTGVASLLLTAAERELRDQQCVHITLDTTEPLRRAIGFYEKHGYRPSGRVTDFFGMPLFEYEKALTGPEHAQRK